MSLKNYSTTAASNTSAPPNGAPEGWALADINAVMRQVMADVRTLAAADTIASATTCDLGSLDATFITVSGTTTITGLGTVSAGIYKHVTFSGALILTYNATSLLLPGAANITTVAGDTALFLSLGSGNWKCMSYQPVNAYQPLDSQLTTLAGITAQQATDLSSVSTFIGTLLNDADAATARTTLGVDVDAATAGFAISISSVVDGYIKLPSWLGGFIVQWGGVSCSGTIGAATPVTFPLAFPNACRRIVLTPQNASSSSYSAWYDTPTTTGFNARGSASSLAVSYIAIGY